MQKSRSGFLQILRNLHGPYLNILAPYRKKAAVCIVISGLAGLFELAALVAIAPILGFGIPNDKATGALASLFANGGIFAAPWVQFCILVGSGLAAGAARWLSLKRVVVLRYDIELSMRESLTKRLFDMDWQRYNQLSTGAVGHSFMSGIQKVGEGIESYLRLWSLAIVVIVLLASAVVLAPELIAIAAVYGLFVGLVSTFVTRKARPWMQRATTHSNTVASLAHEVTGNLKYLRATGLQEWARSTMRAAFSTQRLVYIQNLRFGELHRLGIEAVGITFIALVIIIYKTTNMVALSTFIVFLAIFYRCVPRVQWLQSTLYQAESRLSWISWLETMKQKTQPLTTTQLSKAAKTLRRPRVAPSVAFDRVSFSYQPGDLHLTRRPVLDQLSFRVRPAEFLAITGPSGSGKSTILGLLLGLLHPESGSIVIDDDATVEMDEIATQGLLGYLPQEPQLFSTSILANVALGEDSPDVDHAIACLKTAQAWEFVSMQPEGLATRVGEQGGRLSGGERQRIALARALYRKPSILLLDEPTSALDRDNTMLLGKVLRGLKGKMTIIMITHQTDLCDLADEIVTLLPATSTRTESRDVPRRARSDSDTSGTISFS